MDVRGGPWSNLRLVAGPSFLRPRIGASPRASRTRLYASGATQTVLDALKESVEATLWLWGWPLCLWYPLMLMLMDTFKKMLIFQLGRSSMESLRNHLNYLAWTIRNAPRRRSVQLSAKWQGQPYAVLDLVRMEVLGYKLAFQGWASWCFWAGRRELSWKWHCLLSRCGSACYSCCLFCIEDAEERYELGFVAVSESTTETKSMSNGKVCSLFCLDTFVGVSIPEPPVPVCLDGSKWCMTNKTRPSHGGNVV